eukprot:6054873-Pyramimonas_sp.AAC.1
MGVVVFVCGHLPKAVCPVRLQVVPSTPHFCDEEVRRLFEPRDQVPFAPRGGVLPLLIGLHLTMGSV